MALMTDRRVLFPLAFAVHVAGWAISLTLDFPPGSSSFGRTLAFLFGFFGISIRWYAGSVLPYEVVMSDKKVGAKKNDGTLITTGPFAFVRHPMYFGLLLLHCCSSFLLHPLAILMAVILWIIRWSYFCEWEERALRSLFSGFEEYSRTVPLLILRPWSIPKLLLEIITKTHLSVVFWQPNHAIWYPAVAALSITWIFGERAVWIVPFGVATSYGLLFRLVFWHYQKR